MSRWKNRCGRCYRRAGRRRRKMKYDWLTQLAPEHAPPLQGWWPPAPGWWVVTLLVLVVVGASLYWWRNPRRVRRRTALRELRSMKERSADSVIVARSIQNLLRRYALATFGREQVAKVSGEAWLKFVGGHGGEMLSGECGRSLLTATFGANDVDRRERWFAAAEQFVRSATRRDGRRGAWP